MTSFVVQANQPWQQVTGVSIPPGNVVTITYQSGEWSADNQPGSDPSHYDAEGNWTVTIKSSETGYPVVNANWGALVGKINGGTPFLIGNSKTILSTTGGELELCINDDLNHQYGEGLADNDGSINVEVTVSNTQPDLSQPLVREPAQAFPGVPLDGLGPLKHLIGTWTNQNLTGKNSGGPDSPYSYNVMPLPQVDPSSSTGYILKNFSYYEELTFTAIHGNAPNRGGTGQQVAYTLFYEQRVYFAEGPNKDALVHAENGSLLYLQDSLQPLGPYGNGDDPGLGNRTVQGSTPPTQPYNLVKQVSVPHGNSILALGNYDESNQGAGIPDIPVVSPLPSGVDTTQYTVDDPVANPQPSLTEDPNTALRNALNARSCTNFLTLSMSSANRGSVTNIGYEQQHSNVSQYECTYWLESFDNGQNYTQLQYSQNITLQIPINGGQTITFPHVTVNTLTKVTGS